MELLKKSRAFLLLFVTFFFWGSVYVGGKLISDDVPAPLLGCLRCFVASFPLMLMARKHFGVKIDRRTGNTLPGWGSWAISSLSSSSSWGSPSPGPLWPPWSTR